MTTATLEMLNEIRKELGAFFDTLQSKNYQYAGEFNRQVERLKSIARNMFKDDTYYLERIKAIESKGIQTKSEFLGRILGITDSMIDAIPNTNSKGVEPLIGSNELNVRSHLPEKMSANNKNLKVFIVHGHNEAMKQATARAIEKLGLEAIILHEKASEGNTLIEKFSKHSDVGFAIVLLSADDYGYTKTLEAKNAKLRARQNVIFELGFFFGKLNRRNVVAIFEQNDNFEKPSDIDGIIYIPYGTSEGWKFDLAKELTSAGYAVNANLLL